MSKFCKNNNKNKSVEPEDKSKVIKKNRQSAKMSRLRKKQYQQKLQQRVFELQSQIGQRKASIKNISEKIFNKFLRSNVDKHKYLTTKIQSSKTLLSLMNEIKVLKQHANQQPKISSNLSLEHQQNQLVKVQFSPNKLNNNHLDNSNLEVCKQQCPKGRHRKKKCQEKESQSKVGLEQKIAQKQAFLEIALKNYMYEFGMKGCLRTDVIERAKHQWMQTLNNWNAEPSQQICNGVVGMKNSLQRLDNKAKLLDYHIRELRDKVKDKYAVQFILDRQFFHKSDQTIYNNNQFENSQS